MKDELYHNTIINSCNEAKLLVKGEKLYGETIDENNLNEVLAAIYNLYLIRTTKGMEK